MLNRPLFELKIKAEEIAQKIGAATSMLPDFDGMSYSERPRVIVKGSGPFEYHLVYEEMGHEAERMVFYNEDDILYNIFSKIVDALAIRVASANSVTDVDSRRLAFPYGEALIGSIDVAWQRRLQHDHEHEIQKRPFDDFQMARLDYYLTLIKSGMSNENAHALAEEKYPR